MIAFGPVPSRRLGNSLGINHIPPKHCTYACVYCQVGKTDHLQITSGNFYSVEQITQEVGQKIHDAHEQGQMIDYLTFVPDGEPTLDRNLGLEIDALRIFGYPIAVISNSSLIDRPDVRNALSKADWVSLKVDSVVEETWKKINRPQRRLYLQNILSGMLIFRQEYTGELVTETMLISGHNDNEGEICKLSSFLLELDPLKSYLSIPTRPPAEIWVKPPQPEILQQILRKMSKAVPYLDILFETESTDFTSTGNVIEDILSIAAVHPIREPALRKLLSQAGAGWEVVENLISAKQITCIEYREDKFFLRKYPE